MEPTTYTVRAKSAGFAVVEHPTLEEVESLPSFTQAERHAERLNEWMAACESAAVRLNRLLASRPTPGAPEEELLLEAVAEDNEFADRICGLVEGIYGAEERFSGLVAGIRTAARQQLRDAESVDAERLDEARRLIAEGRRKRFATINGEAS